MNLANYGESEIISEPYRQYFNAIIALFNKKALNPQDPEKDYGPSIEVFLGNQSSNYPLVTIRRYIAKFLDGNIGIKDEITLFGESSYITLLFELNESGELIICPENDTLTSKMNTVVNNFREGAKIKGSTIYSGTNKAYISDGENWIPYTEESNKIINQTSNIDNKNLIEDQL